MENKPESLAQLKRYVASRIADRWHDVGIQLLFTTEELDQIEQNCRPSYTSWIVLQEDAVPMDTKKQIHNSQWTDWCH